MFDERHIGGRLILSCVEFMSIGRLSTNTHPRVLLGFHHSLTKSFCFVQDDLLEAKPKTICSRQVGVEKCDEETNKLVKSGFV